MTKREFLDILFALAPTEANAIMDAFDEYVESSEPHWIPVEQDTPDEERECWIMPKTTSKVYRGIFTRHYGECHRTGFICDDGFMWLNTALAWMYCEVPEPYKPTVPPECEGDCGWCKTSVIEKCKEVTT